MPYAIEKLAGGILDDSRKAINCITFWERVMAKLLRPLAWPSSPIGPSSIERYQDFARRDSSSRNGRCRYRKVPMVSHVLRRASIFLIGPLDCPRAPKR